MIFTVRAHSCYLTALSWKQIRLKTKSRAAGGSSAPMVITMKVDSEIIKLTDTESTVRERLF